MKRNILTMLLVIISLTMSSFTTKKNIILSSKNTSFKYKPSDNWYIGSTIYTTPLGNQTVHIQWYIDPNNSAIINTVMIGYVNGGHVAVMYDGEISYNGQLGTRINNVTIYWFDEGSTGSFTIPNGNYPIN